uniref:Carboxylic ester hydrolase n=1 Tax=Sinocyclocheilus rhinocerous TaxID=307959 RepID=A0A673JMD6_9TELE
MIKEILLCLCLTLLFVCFCTDSGPVVVLKHGSICGQYMKVKGSEKVVEQYFGIPFAQPPAGPLRLAAPSPVQGWEYILSMVAKSMMLDFTPTGVSEDCLYLNIYTPSQRSESDKLPVMVWIHGGALVTGGACTYDGSPLVYRLGMLGYFSTGDKNAQGNWGFLDQTAALQWVLQNIKGFGGDPQSVTIAGESAGEISASFLTLSPMTKGLFQRAIFQSGVETTGGLLHQRPSDVVANVTECDFSSNEVLTKCIKELTEEQIINAQHIFPGATEVLKSKDFQKVPILVGTTNHEFGWMLPQALFSKDWTSGVNEIIAKESLKTAKTPEDIRDAFTEMLLGDIFMVIPSITVAFYHRDGHKYPFHMYEFQSIFKDLRPSFVNADHGDDLGFVFGACFWDGHIKVGIGTLTEEENQLCRTVMGYWVNFIRTGSPNGPKLVHWPVYDKSNKYMNLELQKTEGQSLKMDKLVFFTEELPKKLAALHKA